MPFEDEWVSFEETETYKNYIIKNSNANSLKEVKNMEMEVHNQLGINYGKTLNTVSFFAQSTLEKFAKKNKWKLEVWLDEKNSKKNPKISCGVALVRPRKSTIYAKKVAGNLNEAIKQSLNVIEKSIRREGNQWNREKSLQLAS